MIKGLVNIITPAYNCGVLIPRLLDSIIEQTYPSVEMFVVDDGSTDNTKAVVCSYIKKFDERGYKLNYIYQENQGQSYAVNNALKLLDGEYLLWPDADDWYSSNEAVSKLVSALKQSDESVGIVRCRYCSVEEGTDEIIVNPEFEVTDVPEYLFENALHGGKGFVWTPGGYAIKLRFIDQFIPNREIYTDRHAGQNAQIIFPYLIYSKCITIQDVLFCVLIRKQSHSRGMYKGYEHVKERCDSYYKTYKETMDSISFEDDQTKARFQKEILVHYLTDLYRTTIEYEKGGETRRVFSELKKVGYIFSKKEKIQRCLSYMYGCNTVFSIIERVINKIRRLTLSIYDTNQR